MPRKLKLSYLSPVEFDIIKRLLNFQGLDDKCIIPRKNRHNSDEILKISRNTQKKEYTEIKSEDFSSNEGWMTKDLIENYPEFKNPPYSPNKRYDNLVESLCKKKGLLQIEKFQYRDKTHGRRILSEKVYRIKQDVPTLHKITNIFLSYKLDKQFSKSQKSMESLDNFLMCSDYLSAVKKMGKSMLIEDTRESTKKILEVTSIIWIKKYNDAIRELLKLELLAQFALGNSRKDVKKAREQYLNCNMKEWKFREKDLYAEYLKNIKANEYDKKEDYYSIDKRIDDYLVEFIFEALLNMDRDIRGFINDPYKEYNHDPMIQTVLAKEISSILNPQLRDKNEVFKTRLLEIYSKINKKKEASSKKAKGATPKGSEALAVT